MSNIFSNSFSEEVWRTKYKWITDDSIEETWWRVAKNLASVEQDKTKWTQEFYSVLENFKFVPGGRITSNAGTNLEGTTYINCLKGDTRIITSDGIKPIKDLVGQNVFLLTRHGKWVKAPILCFGNDKLYKINIRKNKFPKSIFCTADHRWFIKSEECVVNTVTSLELKPGDRLVEEYSRRKSAWTLSDIGIAQGFTYGDGSESQLSGITHASLCGEKIEDLEKYFPKNHRSMYEHELRISGLPRNWKKLPDISENSSFLLGWLAGYFAADGCVDENGSCTIASSKYENISFIKDICSLLGIGYFQDRQQERLSNLTNETSLIYLLTLDATRLSDEFFIRKKHKERFLLRTNKQEKHWRNKRKNAWTVTSIEQTDLVEPVYCAIVPEYHSFVLEGNILTHNCYVDGFTSTDQDSIEGIYSALTRQAQILKSEGGYGFCCDVMRPRGTTIAGIGNQTPGAVRFLELWDKSSEIITAGSGKQNSKNEKQSIRKGAQLVSMSIWHPDIVEFITAKQTPGRLTKFNMSVLCTDLFMHCVEKDQPWYLVYPNIQKYKADYKEQWDGNLDKWVNFITEKYNSPGDACICYHTFDSARELWELIMQSTYNRNEPGVLFIDTVNKMNNLYYCEWINATNPCGEQPLPIGGVCLLGSINIVHFIDPEKQDWKYQELEETINAVVRMLDNVNDLTYVPLEIQKENLQNKRRIGLGILGYASAMLMARVRYGSEQAQKMTEDLMEFYANKAYQASVFLAQEKGQFPLFDLELYLNGQYINKLSYRTQMMIKNSGIRNSHLLSLQPTGNSQVFANVVSGGLEPIFAMGYYRTAIVNQHPDGLELPEHIDWKKKTGDIKDWKWIKEGDEDLLAIKFNDTSYKFDRSRGLTKEEWIEDYGIRWLKERGLWDEKADWAVSAMDLAVEDHINVMSIFAKWVDSAISKTVNIPNDYPYDDFKEIYLRAWKAGIKGITTYRAGTMTTVLSETSAIDDDKINKTNAPKRPKQLECDVHHVNVKGKPYFVLVGLYKGDPYEVFAGVNGNIDKQVKKGIITKVKRNKYRADLEDGEDLSPINYMCDEHEDALTRMTSTSLRHGADVRFIVQQLEKNMGDLQSFSKAIARALKKYIPDGTKEQGCCPECSKETLIRQEGCLFCASCSYSRCL